MQTLARIRVLALVLATCAVIFAPRLAVAQGLTTVGIATRLALDGSERQSTDTRPREPVPATPAKTGRISVVMQSLYISTAAIQGLDALSTFKALNAGAVETNSLVKPLVSNRPAFVALKATMATAFIYAGHDLSKRHKVGAIVALGLVNSLYTAISLHNYHVAHVMDARR